MSSKPSEEDPYALGRDYVSSARLALVHLLIHAQFGYLLHPTITSALSSRKESGDLSVADVGTGTGIWLGELSREFPPSTHFDGFDISDAQYPPQEWYGPNTRLRKLDIFKPLPEELVGKYDVVHLRFFISVAKASNIKVVLRSLRGMLKPGGYLQWVERDWFSKFPKEASKTDDPHTRIAAYLRKYFNETELLTSLPKHFTSERLEVLENIHEAPLPMYRKPWNEANLLGLEAFSDNIPDKEEKAWFKELHARCATDAAKGWYVDFELHIIVGRKEIEA